MSIAAPQDFSYMPDGALQQALQFAQRANDTMKFLGIKAELDKRAQTRTAAQGQQAGQQLAAEGPRTEADKIMSGIANLSSGEHEYANGGIVAFNNGGLSTAQAAPTAVGVGGGAGYVTYKGARMAVDTLRQLAALEGKTLAQMLAADVVAPAAVPAAVAAGGAGLSALGANYLSRLPDESLDTLSNAGGGDDTSMAAAIMRNAKRDMSGPNTPAAPAGPSAVPRVEPRREVRTPELYRDTPRAPQQAPAAPGAAGTGITSLARRSASDTTPTAAPAAPEQRILTAAEQMAADEALAKGRNDKVAAIYAKADARDAKRRAELEGETKATKGLLGIEMDPDIRKAMRTAGIGMLQSQRGDTFGALGEGLAAASKGYDETKQKRQARLDLLDDAEEKRQMAKMAAEQGNMELANKYSKQEADLREKAAGRAFEKEKLTSAERHQRAMEALQKQQIGVSAANANRATDADKYIAAAIKENPKLSYTQAYDKYIGAKGVARPLSQDAAIAQFTKGLEKGIIPAGTNFATWYQEQLDGSAAPGGLALPGANAIAAELAKRKN